VKAIRELLEKERRAPVPDPVVPDPVVPDPVVPVSINSFPTNTDIELKPVGTGVPGEGDK
jgi:hypothetical protein